MGAYRLIPFRRVLDLLVIVALAGGLLWLAGQVAGERQTPQSPVADSLPSDPANAELPELQLLLPLERIGMVLSQETILGDPQSAMDHLDQKCREALASPDDWGLSLVVSEEEQRLLDATAAHESPLADLPESIPQGTRLYPLDSPPGRVGVREATGAGAGTVRRLLCWGFILSAGADSHTVWFARPREKFPRSDSRESPAP